jgi:GT2 family glycosyltransferase
VSVVDHRSALIRDCLRSLMRSRTPSLDVFVVENLPPEEPTRLEAEFPRITMIRNVTPLGFSANHNQAISRGSAAYHLVLNDDTIIPEGVVAGLVAFAEKHPRAGVISPRLVDRDGNERERPTRFPSIWTEVWRSLPWEWVPGALRGYYPAARHRQAFQPDRVTGACVLLRRAALRDVGPFDPAFFMYYEEPDLCRRMHAAGWEVWYVPDVQVTHVGAQTVDRHMTTEWSQTHYYASRLRYFRKHHGPAAAAAMRASVLVIDCLRWLKWFFVWRMSPSHQSFARVRLASAALRTYVDPTS